MSESDEAARRRQDAWDHVQENLSKKTYEDDNPVVLTAYQAAKCAAIVSAALAGDPAWTELAQKVGAFLDVSAAEAKGELIRPTAADLWAQIDPLPWPMATPRP